MKRTTRILALGFALGILASSLSGERANRKLTWRGPVEAIRTVELYAGNGEVTLLEAHSDEVELELEVRAERSTDDEAWRSWTSWFLKSRYENDEVLIQDIDLETDSSGSRLRIRPLPRGRTRESRVRERWILRVPGDLRVKIRGNSLTTHVESRRGAVDIAAGHGEVQVQGCSGDVSVQLQVGRVEFLTAHPVASLFARSRVGSVAGRIFGRRVEGSQEAGPGSELRHIGQRGASVNLELEVGDIRFTIDPPDITTP